MAGVFLRPRRSTHLPHADRLTQLTCGITTWSNAAHDTPNGHRAQIAEHHKATGRSAARTNISEVPSVECQRASAALCTRGSTMSLADRHLAPPAPIHGTPCSIGTLLDTLEGAELKAFEHMLASREWNATMIYDAVRAEGHAIGRQSVNRHRGQRCRCFKDAA